MRYLARPVMEDLAHKMVFVGGPRQCGKTTLARALLDQTASGRYFDWDLDEDRQAILKRRWATGDRLLVFDEIHKFPRWKNWLKGIFAAERENHRILVTGSARLDVYRRGGDSLLGRYHFWRSTNALWRCPMTRLSSG
jgi:predicted AAA+ superfamily ATPase